MTDLTEQDVTRLATASTGWHEATRGRNCDAWLAAGNDLDDAVTRLLDRARRTEPAAAPSFPHAIANPAEVWVYMEPGSPEAARYQDGRVAMGCQSIEHAEVMIETETLTRAYPWWVRAVLVERADGGRPASVVYQVTRDLTVTTWRRTTPQY